MKNITLSAVLGALVLIGVVAGGVYAGFIKGDQPAEGSYKVGVVYALTGPAASWTDYGKKGLEMAVEEINAKGGVNGKKLELVIEDSQSNPATAVSAFQKLTDVDRVDVVVGDVWSFITNPMIPVANQKKVVLISPTVMDKSVEGQSEFFYTLGHTVGGEADSVRKFFEVNPDIKTASILCWNDNWGKAHSALFRQIASEKGVKVVGEECTSDFGTDYRTEMSKVQAQHADAIYLTAAAPEVALKAYTALGMKQKVLTLYIVDAVELRAMPRSDAKNVWFVDWMTNGDFTAKFKAKYGAYPILEAQNHYEAAYSIAHALEQNPASVAEGLKSVKYEGVDGLVDFTQGDHNTVNTGKTKLYRVDPVSGFPEVK